MTKNIKNQQNDKEYWEKQFSNFCEIQMKLAQAKFFYNVFAELASSEVLNLLNSECSSCCDFGCGLGNFTEKLHKTFPNMKIFGMDYSANAIKYASKHFKNTTFLNVDYESMQNNFDIIITSNTLEHFSNPENVMNALLKHTNKYFIMMVPYEENPLYQEHYFSFDEHFFKQSYGDFELIYLNAVDLRYRFNTMWFGKQVLAIYKRKSEHADFTKYINAQTTEGVYLLQKCNYFLNLWRRNIYRFIRANLLNKS